MVAGGEAAPLVKELAPILRRALGAVRVPPGDQTILETWREQSGGFQRHFWTFWTVRMSAYSTRPLVRLRRDILHYFTNIVKGLNPQQGTSEPPRVDGGVSSSFAGATQDSRISASGPRTLPYGPGPRNPRTPPKPSLQATVA